MKKKLLAFILAFVVAVSLMPSAFAYSVRDAYNDFAAQYPEFINVIVENGVSESTLIDFLRALQRRLYIMNRNEPVTEANFDSTLITAVQQVIDADNFYGLQKALLAAYPDAASEAIHGRIHPDLKPLYETAKSMVFEHNMLDSLDNDKGGDVLTIVSIAGLDGVSVEKGKTLSLPSKVDGRTETGVSVPLEIKWSSVPSTDVEGTFTAEGAVTVPAGYQLGSGVSASVTVQVTVTPVSITPGGDDGKDDNNNGDDKKPDNDKQPDRRPNNNNGTVSGGDRQNTDEKKHIYSFSDVNVDTELGQAVYALSDIGIINGYTDGTFKPDNNITRAEIAKIMTTAMETLDAQATASFADTKDHWALIYIASAQKQGLINGYPDGTFKPDNNITRSEAMTIVYRTLDAKKAFASAPAASVKFSDEALIPDWAKTPVLTLANYGIVKGTSVAQPDGTMLNNIDPVSNATRGQCVMMVYNALKMMGKIK